MDDSIMPAGGFDSGDAGYEHLGLDSNGDGLVDGQFQALDVNGDGINDIEIVDVDATGDGVVDASLVRMDLDGDGLADLTSVSVDLDGDGVADIDVQDGRSGVPDMLSVSDHSQDIWGDVDESVAGGEAPIHDVAAETHDAEVSFAAFADTYDDLSFDGFEDFYEVHGTPAEDMALWDEQDEPMSCAVATTNMMFRAIGVGDIGEDVIADYFQEHRVYDPYTGTNPDMIDDVINMFAAEHGVDAEAVSMNVSTAEDFARLLDNGLKPLVGVDPFELQRNSGDRFLEDIGLIPGSGCGHAVQLTGIEHSPSGSFAILNDPGVGAGVRVPLDAFLDAADDFDGKCVVVGTHATVASLEHVTSDGPAEGQLSLGGMTEPLHSDVFGNVFRGNSPFPVAHHPMV